jgi:hypothetical protein
MHITSYYGLSITCDRAVIIRVQIVYLLMFINGPLREKKAVFIAQLSKNVPSYHFPNSHYPRSRDCRK